MIHFSKSIVLALLLVISSTSLFCQVEIVLKVTPDSFPQDISWELQTQDYNNIIASGDLEGCTPFEECEVLRMEVEDGCYTLLIRDLIGDGIDDPGGYELSYNGALVVSNEKFENRIYHNFNCHAGETCEDAIVLELPDRNIWVPDTKEFWLSFTPPQDGFYRINTCLNCPAPAPCADTKMWLYDNCDRRTHNFSAEGAIGYSEFSGECAPGSGFNFLPMDGGKTYYIRHKPLHPWTSLQDDSLQIRFDKLPVKFGCIDRTACNFDPFAQVDNGSCEYNVTCLPDLALDVDRLKASIVVDTVYTNDECFIDEGCLRGPGAREVIRFDTKIDNIGNADYVVGVPEGDTLLFDQENCHGHYHHLGYAEYLIYKGEGQPEPVGFKSGFCVMDLDCSNANGTLPKYLCNNMGITQGCSDIYEAFLDCQWIDITDLEDGQYSIVVRVNHFRLADARGMQEQTYANNSGQACVTIDRSSGKLEVTVDDVCPEYMDCLGVAGGDAVLDCNNECGGLAHYGDLDGTGELEQGDLDLYLDMLENKMPLEGPCHDVNADGDLSIYDALLTYECLLEEADNIGNPFHTHCSFPAGNDVQDEMAVLRVSDFNLTDKFLDLELWVSDRNLNGYQLSTEGIVVKEVEKLYAAEPDEFRWNDQEVFAMHTSQEFERNTGYEPFVRIYFSEITSDSLCMTYGSEFINNQFNRVSLVLENACYYISAVGDLKSKQNISIVPNPANDQISVFADGKYINSARIIDVDGKVVMSQTVANDGAFQINISSIPEGIYMMQLDLNDGQVATKRFMKI